VLGSIWFGRRSLRLATWPRYALWAGSAVLVLVAMGGFVSADSTSRGSIYTDVNNYDNNPYGHVQDVFVYDGQGRLVDGARLFDQDGQPIRLGNPYCYGASEFGDATPAPDDSKYPYCAENAPFRMPMDGADASGVPAEADPLAPATETAAPAPTSPSPSLTKTPAAPAPSK
jgi:hypothetical protein